MTERITPEEFIKKLKKETDEIGIHFPELDVSFRKKLIAFSELTLNDHDLAWYNIQNNLENEILIKRNSFSFEEELARMSFLDMVYSQMKAWQARSNEIERHQEYYFYCTLYKYLENYLFLNKKATFNGN
ncbi:MAG TPA: hypothetical protein PKU93_03445 [Candidatus Pacearchaeota archaeon]|nr:hypothetical protein [Candidatus Pacearchaeota archaeon]